MNAGSYLWTRLFRSLLTLFAILLVAFLATRLSGDPTQWLLGDTATPAQQDAMRSELGIDKPIPEQFLRYLRQIVRGDFGTSYFEHRDVLVVLGERLPPTLQLMALAIAFGFALGITIGIVAAVNHDRWIDRALMMITFWMYAVPNFVLAIAMILVFSLWLHWLPSSSYGTWAHAVMPTLALGSSYAALVARITRSSMLDTLGQDYVRTATAKGLARRVVILKHCLRNALLPVVTLVGLVAGSLVGGSVVIETVFAWPGAGRLIVNAVLVQDYPVLQVAVLLVATVVIITNFLVDSAYALIDPRVQYAR